MSKIKIFTSDSSGYYKIGTVDWLDQGHGVLVYLDHLHEKTSRHSDGRTYRGPVGPGEPRPFEMRVPFSQISSEIVRAVSLPSTLTFDTVRHTTVSEQALVFPASDLASATSVAAQVVADSQLESTLEDWRNYPGAVSAQTVHANALGQNLILTVMKNART